LNRAEALQGLLRSAYFFPPSSPSWLAFRWLFQTEGPVNALLSSIGISLWLGSTTWAMPVLILLSIWKQLVSIWCFWLDCKPFLPVVMRQLLDGADAWQQFWHITHLDYVPPSSCNDHDCHFTLRSFEQVYVITGGGPNSTNLLVTIYEQAFAQFDFGYAAAAATVLLAIALLLVYLQLRTWGEES